MTQTLALFLDAYRELNARKLFWITLVISGVVVLAFALIGINEQGLRIIAWDVSIPGLNSTVLPQPWSVPPRSSPARALKRTNPSGRR